MALGRLGRHVRLWEPPKGLFCAFLQSRLLERRMGGKRHLLSEDVLKLQDFQQRKLAVAHLVTGSKGNYFELFNEKLKKNELILKDELKLLFHLCQSADDMGTVRDAIYRYHEENRNLVFGEYRFGPIFMRLCYELGLEELAAATITDKTIRGFFNDSTSFNIAIDMLFTKGYYEEALGVAKEMKTQGVSFNKDTFTLASGACYKLNTPESLRICETLIEEGETKGYAIPRHAYCFAVTLALRQNNIEKAQSFYSHIVIPDSRVCQNLKISVLAMSGDIFDAISILSAAILPKSPVFVKKLEFSQEVVDLLLLRSLDGPHKARIEQVVSELEQAGQVTKGTLDEMLCRTPTGKRKPIIMEQRKTSRRTLRPLQSTLVSE